jgi:hypothetical protein
MGQVAIDRPAIRTIERPSFFFARRILADRQGFSPVKLNIRLGIIA